MDKGTTTQKDVIKRVFSGVVVKKTADKTVRVKVARTVVHSKYKKRYTRHENYLVHDPKNQFEVGEKVSFEQCRPISKMKRWRVLYESAKK